MDDDAVASPAGAACPAGATTVDAAIDRAIARLRDWQGPDGWWCRAATVDPPRAAREVAPYLLLNRALRRHHPERERVLLDHLLAQQAEDGMFGDLGGSVLVYQALKLAGHGIDDAPMVRARAAIRAAGGVAACDLSARRWLATLGEFPWAGVPTVPVELVLLPAWAPLSLPRIATAVRPAVVALMLQSAHRWSAHLSPEQGVQELWTGPPTAVAVAYPDAASPWSWRHVFVAGDRLARGMGYTPLVGLHRRAVARAIEWLLQRQQPDGTWPGDRRVTIDAVLALHAIGFTLDHPVMARALTTLDAQSTNGPRPDAIWQTAHGLRALHAAGVAPTDPAVAVATSAVLAHAITATGDWATAAPHAAPGGWAADRGAAPCIDTTATLVAALAGARAATADTGQVLARATGWATAMQSWNGGYATTDVHQTGSLWAQTALADELSLADPPTPATTGRVLVAMAVGGFDRHLGRAWRAIEFLRHACDPRRAWDGCVVQTALALGGLAAIGEPLEAAPFAGTVEWLRQAQRPAGDWAGGVAASPAVATAAAGGARVRLAGRGRGRGPGADRRQRRCRGATRRAVVVGGATPRRQLAGGPAAGGSVLRDRGHGVPVGRTR